MTRRRLLALLASPVLAAVPETRLEDLGLEATIPIQAALDHVQGIDVRDGRLWVTSVDRERERGLLHRFELPSGRLLHQTEVQRGECYHPGGIALDGDSIWVPVAEYRPRSSALMQRRRSDTLELEASFPVADHIGCVAADAGRLIGGNWDSELLYEWTRQGKEIARKSRLSEARYQDLKLSEGLLVASGNLSREQGVVEWLSPITLEPLRRIVAGKTDRGVLYTHEGMAVRDGRLYLLPEDGPSRLFVFRLAGS
ncbi:MAG: hypothetical protein GC160_21310 [Acidobacteria bacterium]|nr:hypothetical protein [Acidobacteriota bacterium]